MNTRIIFFIVGFFPLFVKGQSLNQNFISESIPLDEDGANLITNVTYFDGIGREIEKVTSASGTGTSVYSAKCYDGRGKVVKSYLPVGADRSFQFEDIDALSVLSEAFYNNDNTAFSSYHYDSFGKVKKEELPGQAWRQRGKEKSKNFGSNLDTDRVLHYEAPLGQRILKEPSSTEYTYYPAGSLQKMTQTDADGHYVTQFKDLFGNIILERRNIGDTYYVYNSVGQLRYILTPLYQEEGNIVKNAYEYQYDDKGNLVKKKYPTWEYNDFTIRYWYDKEKHLTFVQDNNLAEKGKIRFMLYDKYGRLAIQGLCSSFKLNPNDNPILTYHQAQGGLASTDYLLESKYSDMMNNPEIEIVNYYDDYSFQYGSRKSGFSSIEMDFSMKTKGCLTGCIVKASNGEYIYKTMKYDIKGNIIEVYTKGLNQFVEKSYNTYTFTNQLSCSRIDVELKNNDKLKAILNNTYNQYNDKLSTSNISIKQGQTESPNIVVKYEYGKLGQLKKLSRPISGNNGNISYHYDLHGWITEISSGSFVEQLYYAEGHGKPCYNGNISSLQWSRGENGLKRGYMFSYDGLNRLSNAVYGENSLLSENIGKFSEQMTYDNNGKIMSLKRCGQKQDESFGLIDDLTMTYNDFMVDVHDDAEPILRRGSIDFKATNARYTYNNSGMLDSDDGCGIAMIDYDENNMLKRIQFVNGNVIKYIFTATGQKLRTIHYTAVPNVSVAMGGRHELAKDEILSSDSIDYLCEGNLILKNGQIDKYLFVGGYIQKDMEAYGEPIYPYGKPSLDSGSRNNRFPNTVFHENIPYYRLRPTFKPYFYTADHLGNIREVLDVEGKVVQLNDYYPFGLPYSDTGSMKGTDIQPYKYNGKEFQTMHGLHWYDYGARMYDPIICRWNAVDPLAEKFYNVTPYSYCGNNPVCFFDPNGKEKVQALNPNGYIISVSNEYMSNSNIISAANNFQDEPSVINYWAHGNLGSMMTYSYATQSEYNRSPKDFLNNLEASSRVWKNRKQGNALIIVLHSCHTGDNTKQDPCFAQQLSELPEMKNVTIIAPVGYDTVVQMGDKWVEIGSEEPGVYQGKLNGKIDKPGWTQWKEGKLTQTYEGYDPHGNSSNIPGGKGFQYSDSIWYSILNFFKDLMR